MQDPHCHSSSIAVSRPAESAFEIMSDGLKQGRWALGSLTRREVEPGLFELKMEPEVVKIKHGTTAKVKVSATRKGYQGPIPITLRNLPKAVTAPKAVMTPTTNARPQRTRRLTLLSSSRADEPSPTTDRDEVSVAGSGVASIWGTTALKLTSVSTRKPQGKPTR